MSEKYIIFNKRIRQPLFTNDFGKMCSKMIIDDYEVVVDIIKKQPKAEDLIPMKETTYIKIQQESNFEKEDLILLLHFLIF